MTETMCIYRRLDGGARDRRQPGCRWVRRAVYLVAFAGSLVSQGCSDEPCDPDSWSRSRAGASARDCGAFEIGESRGPGWDCAVAAFEEGVPFRVQFAQQGIDSHVVEGSLGDPDGGIWRFVWDDYDTDGPVITAWACIEPHVTQVDAGVWVELGYFEAGQAVVGCQRLGDTVRACE